MANTSKFFCRASSGTVYESADGKAWEANDVALSRSVGDAAIKEQAKQILRELLNPGNTVYTVIRHTSASGMQRSISAVVTHPDGTLRTLDFLIAKIGLFKFDKKHGGLILSGCGMDMGFHLVYSLGATLWPNGTPAPHGSRNGEPDSAGGYALRQEWI